jgi:hypothetical protein
MQRDVLQEYAAASRLETKGMSDDHTSRGIKSAQINIGPNATVTLGEAVDVDLHPEDRAKIDRVRETLKAYRAAVREMLGGRYADLKAVAPKYMTDACCAMAFLLPDGIIVRHDLKSSPDQKGFVAVSREGNLASLAPHLSGSFVHCPDEIQGYNPGEQVVTLTLSAGPEASSAPPQPFVSHRLYVVAGRNLPTPSHIQTVRRPIPLVGLRNEFDLQLTCELSPEQSETGSSFVLRSRVRLPLSWEAFEVFPPYDHNVWDPSVAPQWAENDLLASVIQQNLVDAHFRSIDPLSQTRKEVAQMLGRFEKLLEGPEEPLHQYIKTNPQLLLPTKVQSWSKLALGAHVTDFVLRDASGDYLLVELEKPSHALFGKKGKARVELEHAIDQTVDWKRYLAENVSTVQRELGLTGISTNPRALVVIGRSSSLTEENRRKLTAIENHSPKLKIMTYDDLLASARATYQNILGPIWDPGPNAEVYFLPQGPQAT